MRKIVAAESRCGGVAVARRGARKKADRYAQGGGTLRSLVSGDCMGPQRRHAIGSEPPQYGSWATPVLGADPGTNGNVCFVGTGLDRLGTPECLSEGAGPTVPDGAHARRLSDIAAGRRPRTSRPSPTRCANGGSAAPPGALCYMIAPISGSSTSARQGRSGHPHLRSTITLSPAPTSAWEPRVTRALAVGWGTPWSKVLRRRVWIHPHGDKPGPRVVLSPTIGYWLPAVVGGDQGPSARYTTANAGALRARPAATGGDEPEAAGDVHDAWAAPPIDSIFEGRSDIRVWNERLVGTAGAKWRGGGRDAGPPIEEILSLSIAEDWRAPGPCRQDRSRAGISRAAGRIPPDSSSMT